jgi:acetyl-CoA carboxylase biotin carboxylase subunit
LPFAQADIKATGHAIEARITAEDSEKNFAPSCGKVTTWRPPVRDDVRMETHVYEGFTITPFYDPMIAKLIVTGSDRADAISRLKTALADFKVEGIKTNIPFLRRLIEEPDYESGEFHTGTVPRLMNQWHGS